jgi:hypothetical protein
MKAITTAQKRPREYSKHGLVTLKRAINSIGNRLIDRRTVTGRALAKWRSDLIADLGGNVSTQQSALIDLAVKSKLLLDSIDAWLLTQPTLINKRRKSLLPVVRERQVLADGLARYLMALGLARVEKPSLWPWEEGADQDPKAEAESDQGEDSEGKDGEPE